MTTATDPRPPAAGPGPHLLRLVGEPFLFLRRSYGDELVLHFGERVFGPARRTRHGEFRYEHGTYRLHLRGSAWVVKAGGVPGVYAGGLPVGDGDDPGRPLDPEDPTPAVTPGARVTAVIPFGVDRPAVTGIGLRVELSDGATVVVIPTRPDEPEPGPDGTPLPDPADWELRAPDGTLAAGPGRRWHFTPAGG
ncbi:MAG: hypothetical protein C0501_11825 [Isosphaera sp.]|nr:hypothetical protein [Isosphaera sp.]